MYFMLILWRNIQNNYFNLQCMPINWYRCLLIFGTKICSCGYCPWLFLRDPVEIECPCKWSYFKIGRSFLRSKGRARLQYYPNAVILWSIVFRVLCIHLIFFIFFFAGRISLLNRQNIPLTNVSVSLNLRNGKVFFFFFARMKVSKLCETIH